MPNCSPISITEFKGEALPNLSGQETVELPYIEDNVSILYKWSSGNFKVTVPKNTTTCLSQPDRGYTHLTITDKNDQQSNWSCEYMGPTPDSHFICTKKKTKTRSARQLTSSTTPTAMGVSF